MPNLIPTIHAVVSSYGPAHSGIPPLDLQALAETTLQEYVPDPLPELRSIHLKDENAKWRVLSSLQKAVRRGNVVNVVAMASALINSGQTDHLLRRSCVIALEDVAFANPTLCAAVMAFASSTKVRTKVGGWPVLVALLIEMAESAKDRLPNEIVVSANLFTDQAEERKKLYAKPHDLLLEVANNPDQHHWQDVLTAMRFLSGHIKLGEDFAKDHRHVVAYRACFDDTPGLIRYIGNRAAAMGGEVTVLAAGMRLAWHLLFNHPDADPITVVDAGLAPAQVVKGILLPGLDMHTLEGKRAFGRLFKNEGADFVEWAKSLELDHARLFGLGVFIAEGKLCDKRLSSPDIDRITHVSHEATISPSGLPVELLGMLVSQAGGLLSSLDKHRAAVLMS